MALHSATKYLTGHHDALLGATVTRDPALLDRLYQARMRLGLVGGAGRGGDAPARAGHAGGAGAAADGAAQSSRAGWPGTPRC